MWVDSFSLQLTAPLGTAAGQITERRGFLVGTEQDGIQGLGEATPLPGWTESYEACQTALEKATLSTESESNSQCPDPTTTPAAAHAVELARLDAQAQQEHKPLAALLRQTGFDFDDPIPESVPINATIGNTDLEATVDAAAEAVDEGFEWLKLKVGVQSPESDLERIRAVRNAVDETVRLRLDANGAWDRPTARRMVDQLAEIGIEYLEQPLPASDLTGHAELRGRGVDIAVDESVAEHSVETVIETDTADVIIVKPMAVGGPHQAVEVAATAQSAGIEPVVTTTIDGVVARTAAVHVAAAIPDITACGLATGSLLATDLAADPVSITDGKAFVPRGNGLCADQFDELRHRTDTPK
jgi:o-succinylbenzoate synthase